MSQNYPNPFNPSTKIDYDLPYDGKVSIILYDISGREVAGLVNEVKTAGYYQVNFNASNLQVECTSTELMLREAPTTLYKQRRWFLLNKRSNSVLNIIRKGWMKNPTFSFFM